MNKRSIGIMQGRLTPMKGRGIQFFPFDNWEREFFLAQEIGLNEIEWIFDWEDYKINPIWSQNGRKQIAEIIDQSKIVIHSICFDYFMRRPFYKADITKKNEMCNENEQILTTIIEAAVQVGARLIEIPMVDNSSLKNEEEQEEAITFIRRMSEIAEEHHICLGLETDLPPVLFRKFLEEIDRKNVVANYDSGNSSGLGYNHQEELISLDEYVYNVHIKDRIFKGTTVELGTGSADFDAVFSSLKQIGYQGSIILQAARGEEYKEMENIVLQKKFLLNYSNQYCV